MRYDLGNRRSGQRWMCTICLRDPVGDSPMAGGETEWHHRPPCYVPPASLKFTTRCAAGFSFTHMFFFILPYQHTTYKGSLSPFSTLPSTLLKRKLPPRNNSCGSSPSHMVFLAWTCRISHSKLWIHSAMYSKEVQKTLCCFTVLLLICCGFPVFFFVYCILVYILEGSKLGFFGY